MVKHVVIKVPNNLATKFKEICQSRNSDMTKEINKMIKDCVVQEILKGFD